MYLNVWLIILLFFVAVAFIAVSVYAIITLIQVKKTAREMQEALRKVNYELDLVNKVSGKVTEISSKLSAPVISVFSALFYVLSSVLKSGKKNKGRED